MAFAFRSGAAEVWLEIASQAGRRGLRMKDALLSDILA
jgi:hypothetical protein